MKFMISTLTLAFAISSSSALPPIQPRVQLTPEVAVKLREIAFQAAREGDVETLREFFSAGRPVNEVNSRGDTLLTVAAYRGQEKAVDLILAQKGVEVDARNRMGLTALAAAAFHGHVGIAMKLVSAKAKVDAANGSGQTALMFAALAGKPEMVEFLLGKGADPRAADKSGNTPRSLAQAQGATEVVRRLDAALARP